MHTDSNSPAESIGGNASQAVFGRAFRRVCLGPHLRNAQPAPQHLANSLFHTARASLAAHWSLGVSRGGCRHHSLSGATHADTLMCAANPPAAEPAVVFSSYACAAACLCGRPWGEALGPRSCACLQRRVTAGHSRRARSGAALRRANCVPRACLQLLAKWGPAGMLSAGLHCGEAVCIQSVRLRSGVTKGRTNCAHCGAALQHVIWVRPASHQCARCQPGLGVVAAWAITSRPVQFEITGALKRTAGGSCPSAPMGG